MEYKHTLEAAVHFKSTVDWESHIQERTCIQSNATEQLNENWKDEFAISVQNQAYKQSFIDMQSRFLLMRNGHFGPITMTKYSIELLQSKKALVHAAPYQTGVETHKSKKAEIDEMLSENVIEPAQTKCAALIVFVLKKDKPLQFCVHYRKPNTASKRES